MIKRRLLLLLLGITFLAQETFGTAQFPDFLIYKGDTLSIFANPLEVYFDNHPRPDSIFDKYGYNSTACWRGYIGYWELRNDSLFLIELHGDTSNIDLSLIFKDRKIDNRIFADWYSYNIINPYGKLIYYEHMGYESIYEFEKEFIFSKGVLTDIKKYNNSKSRKSKYTHDNKLLVEYLKANINNSLLPDTVDKIRVFVQINKVTLDGEIDSVSIVKGYNELFDKEAIRVVKSIPEWDILYRHGESLNLIWTIPVIFENKK